MGTLPDHHLSDPAARNLVAEFACLACGSPAVVYQDPLSDDAPVKCQRCQTILCTLREFRLSAEPGMARIQIFADGPDRTPVRSGWRLVDRLFRRLAFP